MHFYNQNTCDFMTEIYLEYVEWAKGKPTYQSSTQSGGYSNRAVDGRMDLDYDHGSCTHTKKEANPWWSVDLQAEKSIRYVVLYNRRDCCSEYFCV